MGKHPMQTTINALQEIVVLFTFKRVSHRDLEAVMGFDIGL